ncbi:MAG: Peptidase S8 and S53 subtilisin kexin sedolisin [Parcubacteria group bacterium GW2011_GWC2_42_13]|nr:MAG: Peptidase S8 and S53 subtilisin kexin sedolisin [Parcubacteria group bacterium GW2011_GWC2_42_13]
MKKILSHSFILGVVFSMAAVGVVMPTSSQVQAASNNKVDVFVSFDKTPGVAERAIVERAGGTVRFSYTIVPAVAASVPEAAIKGLLNNPNVTAELENAWGVKRISSGTVHDGGNKGTDVKIGIIDSGVDRGHQDLNDVYAGGYDFVQDDADPDDVYGHGTHVAGTACAEDNDLGVVGVAPGCALYSLRVLNDSGSGSWSATIAAMDWAVLNRLQVVNLSLGSSQDPGSTVKAAFDNAEAKGLVIVAAGGNSGTPSGKGNNVIYPAKYASVIAVAATDKNDTRPSWSSTGEEIELAAPGVSVLSSWNDGDSPHNPQPFILDGDWYKEGSGTSMASPHVAGAAALVIAAGVTDSNGNGRINDEVRAILNSTADDIGAVGKDTHYGYGLVNVAAAIASLVPPSPAVNVNVSADKTSYESGVDTTAVLTAAITDEKGNAISGLSSPNFATMVNGAATVVSFAETATPGTYTGDLGISSLADGDYTVEVTATDTRSISGSGTANFSIGPAPSEPTTAIVNSITYTTEGGKNSNKHLNIHIAVVDDFGGSVANASVSIELYLDTVRKVAGTGTTGSNGMVTFTYKNAPSGHYETKITGVTATGLTWNGATPPNGYDK